ncbi:MAG: HlyD family efflux transporter periplasmic adaptor subunit [Magnetococcales bacterium]|nr:HlyD family efflux transporter periplasmic adaptor subunit [Magnetococcales bacterium]
MTNNSQTPLASLLQLAKKSLQAQDESAFGFLLVNETHFLTPYRQAALWYSTDDNEGQIQALSGLANPEQRTPYIEFLTELLRKWDSMGISDDMVLVRDEMKNINDIAQWERWLPKHAIWLPLISKDNHYLGGMLLAREKEWSEFEIKLLGELSTFYSHGWDALLKRSITRQPWLAWIAGIIAKKWMKLALFIFAIGVFMLPVRLTVLAPATIVAKNPSSITSPISGVIDQLYVSPYQLVKKGEVIFTLDKEEVQNQLIIAKKALGVIRAQYRLAQQQNLIGQIGKAQTTLLQKRMEQQMAEVNAVQDIYNRHLRVAPHDGFVLFDNIHEWENRPVKLGEQILKIAHPLQNELEILLPMGNAIDLDPGSKTVLFPDINPLRKIDAKLDDISYNAKIEPGGEMSYRLTASFERVETNLKIGMR